MNIVPCTNWECINSFSNWISALGTIFISSLALWLSVKDRLIRVRAYLDVGLVPGNDHLILDRRVFILSFTNIGPRPVTVTNHSWFFPFSKGYIALFPQMDERVSRLCTQLPIELTDGKSGHIFYPNDFFLLLEEPERVFLIKHRFLAWIRIHFFAVKLSTSIGKHVRVVVKPSVRKELWRQYEEYGKQEST
jgi:hypothetical protein